MKFKINLNKVRNNKGGSNSSLYLRYKQVKNRMNIKTKFDNITLNDKIDTIILIKSNEVLKNFKNK
tara:strand:- start:585 stop:782 length:198 start_codon:yes stop_codon:yes gene_type:complete